MSFNLPDLEVLKREVEQTGGRLPNGTVVLAPDLRLEAVEHHIKRALQEAQQYPADTRMFIIFNGTPVQVYRDSCARDVFDKWVLTRKLHQRGIEISLP